MGSWPRNRKSVTEAAMRYAECVMVHRDAVQKWKDARKVSNALALAAAETASAARIHKASALQTLMAAYKREVAKGESQWKSY